MLDWDDFRAFLAIARRRSLSAAARELGVNQSTISRRLTAFEAKAQARLLARSANGYALTAAGEAVLQHAEEMEARALAAERSLAGHDARPEGRVRLAASDSFATWLLVPRLAGLTAQNPGLTVELVTGNRTLDLTRREADISIRLSKPSEPHLVARRLGLAAWALYGSQAYLASRPRPRLAQSLRGHDVIGFDSELGGTIGARWLARHAGAARVTLQTSSLITQAEAVRAGLGLCPLPCLFGDRAEGVRRALPASIGQHEIWQVVHPDVHHSARVRVVLDYLANSILAESALLSGKLSARRRR